MQGERGRGCGACECTLLAFQHVYAHVLLLHAFSPCHLKVAFPGSTIADCCVCPHERPLAGAVREVLEETDAVVRAEGIVAVISVPAISQVGWQLYWYW